MIYLLDDDCVIFKSYKLDVKVYFDGGEASYIELDDVEYETSEDCLHGLYAYYGDRFVPIYNLIITAVCEYEKLKEEAECEAQDNYDMMTETRSPFLSGRI